VTGRTAVIFGGAGFFGTHLARSLQTSGEYTRIVSVDISAPSAQLAGVDYLFGDVRQPILLEGLESGAEIYNFAAVHTTPGHEEWEYFWTNELGAINVCNFAVKVSATTIFFASSISTYGPTEAPLDENGPFAPNSSYGRSKLIAEAIHRAWQNAAPNRRLRIIRAAVVFGSGERGNFTRLASALRRKRFFYPGRDNTVKSCGYVGELVRSMIFVRDLPDAEITYNFAYPDSYTTRDICANLCSQAKFEMPKIILPEAAILGAGCVFEILAALGIKTSINRARIRKLMLSTNIVPRKLAELGYQFETDLKEGIQRWYLESQGKFD